MKRGVASVGLVVVWLLAGCSSGGSDSLLGDDGGGALTSDGAPGAGIFGKLVDESEVGVAGASIELVDESDRRVAGPVTTAGDGSFDLPLADTVVPENAVLVIRPPNRPEARADVIIPPGARVEFLVSVDGLGGAMVVPVLEPPVDAPPAGVDRGRAVLLAVDATGSSEPFQLGTRGEFDAARSEFRLVYRARGDAFWTVASDAPERQTPRSVPLRLGARAAGLHGQRLEVRALAFPPGRLDGVTSFRQPLDLGPEVTLSPEPVFSFPVVTRAERLGVAGLLANAIVVRGGGNTEPARMSSADLAALGLTAGGLATLSHGQLTVRIQVAAAEEPLLSLATLVLPPFAAEHLGLALNERVAGYTIGLAPAEQGEQATRPGGGRP